MGTRDTVSGGPGAGRRTLSAFRAIFVLSALAALVLGYAGFAAYLGERPEQNASPLDVAYNVLQLFVISAPALDHGGPYPWTLEVARFAAPLATAHALAEGVRLLLTDRLERLRISRTTGHAVVCGAGPEAEVLTARLRARGATVVRLPGRPGVSAEADSQGMRDLVVHGDPQRPEVLRGVGIARAAVLYVFGADAAANTAVAQVACRQSDRGGGPRAVYIEIPDPQLCAALRARRLGSTRAAETTVDFFNLAELGAHALAGHRSELAGPPRRGAVVIAGLSAFGAALLVELARAWRISDPAHKASLAVTVVDPDARKRLAALYRRYPFLERACTIVAHEGDLTAALPDDADAQAPVEVYVCYDDEEHALATMLTDVRLWQCGGPVTVRLEHLAAFRSAFHGGDSLLDEVAGRLHLFSVVDAACDPELIATDLTEQLARAHHEHYVADRMREGETKETNSLLVPWHVLNDTYRRTNRDAVAHISAKLTAIGCALGPNTDPAHAHPLQRQEVERLSIMEHERWMRERLADGWSYAPKRDDTRKHHPNLLPWQRLSEAVRDKDRDAIRALPAILSDAGFQIIRVGTVPGHGDVPD